MFDAERMGAGQGHIVGIRLDHVGGKVSDTWQHAVLADAETVSSLLASSLPSCTQWMKGREFFEHVGEAVEEPRLDYTQNLEPTQRADRRNKPLVAPPLKPQWRSH